MNNQNIFTSKEKWNEIFNGWLISDCALRTNKMVNLILRKDLNEKELSKLWDSEVPTRLVTINLEFSRIGYADFDNGFAFPRAGVARKPLIQGLTASRNRIGQVYFVSADLKQMEEITPIGKIEPSKGIATQKLKCIDGWAYAVGSFRDIYKRVDIGKWEPVMNGFPELTSEQIRNVFLALKISTAPTNPTCMPLAVTAMYGATTVRVGINAISPVMSNSTQLRLHQPARFTSVAKAAIYGLARKTLGKKSQKASPAFYSMTAYVLTTNSGSALAIN